MLDKKSWVYPVYKVVYDSYRREVRMINEDSFMAQIRPIGVNDLSVQEKGRPEITNGKMELMGCATLRNDTNEPQVLTSGEFEKEITSSWSTTATDTRTFGGELEYKACIGPRWFRSEIRVEFHLEFSHSEAKTRSGSETLRYKLPGQSITVPPRSVRYISCYLVKGNAVGAVDLLVKTEGAYRSSGVNWKGEKISKNGSIYNIIDEMSKVSEYPKFKLIPAEKKVQFVGTAQYTIDAAFEVSVQVTDTPPNMGESNDGVLEEYRVIPEILAS
ncbi:ETX/MTX2 family pore-forming toxin [Citrobacter braakii]|uniref:ETX/MTX2 family pore-forming toxin n=1 Tax=Citrobacter braakii TaxID=57706 RepID=UPI001906EB79|nr:ETX/MTX2 family pore-forming toxin [Citrobacter braakii]MBJ8899246.1 ETX/MTX2 family pore-forming toxin [Citrobacter braakii]